MKYVLLVLLSLTAVAIPAARITYGILGTSPWRDAKQKYNLYNWLWIIGLLIGVAVAPVPWWMGLTLLPFLLAICAWSISAAIDHDTTNNFGDLLDRWTWGAATGGTKRRLIVRRYVSMGVLALLVFTWIGVATAAAITGDGGSDNNAAPTKDNTATSAPAAAAPTAAKTTQAAAPAPASSTLPPTKASKCKRVPTYMRIDVPSVQNFKPGGVEVCTPGANPEWQLWSGSAPAAMTGLYSATDGTYIYAIFVWEEKEYEVRTKKDPTK